MAAPAPPPYLPSVRPAPGWEGTPIGSLVTLADFAAEADVSLNSVQSYRSKGMLPAPIGTVSTVPVWTREQLVGWKASRPGRGRRTDLATST